MTTLAERIEAADGPDRELDAMIWLAIHRPDYHYPDQVLNRIPTDRREAVERFTHDGMGGGSRAPAYTASIDAAMTLVDDARAILNIAEDGITTAIVDGTQGVGSTPALALTAATLRARESKP